MSSFFIRFWYDDPKIKFQIYTESNYLSTINSNFQRYYHYLGNLMISVLYVDDESALLEITKLFLEGFNDFVVETAISAQDGLDLLKEQSFDAIVSDYQMPGMDGIAFLKAVRERFGDLPFILFTGRGREEVVISAINNGADFYLQKGGDPTAQFAELSHKIRQSVGRRQAEENLRETNEYLTNLITYASGPIVTWDVDFKITRFNRAFENLTGFHEADLLGKDFDSLFPEASRVHSLDLISRALFGEKWDAVEIPVRTADGGNRTIIWNSANIYHRDGKTLVATIAQGIDITERKKTEDNLKIAYESVTAAEEELRQNYDVLSKNEEALRESEEKFRTLVENALEGILILDSQKRILFINRAGGLMVDVADYQAMIGKNVLEYIAPESQAEVLADFGQVTQGIDVYLVCYKLLTETKREIWVECVGKKIPFQNSAAILVSIRDITERKRAEDELGRSYSVLKGVVESPKGVVIFALDRQYRYIAFNKNHSLTMKQIWGADIALGISMPEYIRSPDDRKKAIANFDRALSGESFTLVEVYGDTELERRWYEDIYNPITDENGNVIGLTVYLTDMTDRKVAEKALRESKDLYQTLAESSPDMIYLIDKNGYIRFTNSLAAKQFRLSPSDLTGKKLEEVFAPDVARRHMDAIALIITSGKSISYEIFESFPFRDYWIHVRLNPLKNAAGEVTHVLGISSEITERKLAEKAVRESEERFRSMAERSSDLIIIINEGLKPAYVSPSALSILGYDPEEIVGMSPESAAATIFSECGPEFMSIVQATRKGLSTKNIEIRIIKKDGVPLYVSIHAVPVNDDGIFAGVQVTMRDITASKKAEMALKESEEQYRSLAEQVHDGIYIYQGNHFVFANSFISRITGYSNDELLSMDFNDLVHPDDRAYTIDLAERRRRGEQVPDIYEARIIQKDGSVRYAELAVAIVLFSGEPAVLGTARDITERVHAENALRLANRKLNLLAGITRHDILNNISVILGFLKITEKKFKDPALLELLGKMESATTAIRSQIEFTRIYKDLGTHEPQWMDLDTVMSRSHVPRTIVLNADVHGVVVFADPMLEKVFFNLLDNSIRHGQRVTEIRVSYQQSGEDLVVVWEDNGVGIAENEKERIFERGFGKNTGLGMFLVREILSLTGITIRETGVPGTGARFEIRVPKGAFHRHNLKIRPGKEPG